MSLRIRSLPLRTPARAMERMHRLRNSSSATTSSMSNISSRRPAHCRQRHRLPGPSWSLARRRRRPAPPAPFSTRSAGAPASRLSSAPSGIQTSPRREHAKCASSRTPRSTSPTTCITYASSLRGTTPSISPWHTRSGSIEHCGTSRTCAPCRAQVRALTMAQLTWTTGRCFGSLTARRSTSCVSGATSPSPRIRKRNRLPMGLPSVHWK